MDVAKPIGIEVAYKKGFNKKASNPELERQIHEILSESKALPKDYSFAVNDPNVERVTLCDQLLEHAPRSNLKFYTYTLQDGEAEQETIDDQGGDEIQIANHWLLPAREFHGLWESLIYEDSLKENLLSFVHTTALFSQKAVNANLIACNRLVLLHGPPGTGKTSLCQALAQKLAIRMNKSSYKHFHLFEINSHSLFSKWFSESGKLVQKVFGQINDLCQDPSSMVCVLVDEVESIAFAREAISNNEPSDSIRVVNAVLTQLDRIRRFPNVMVLATSNLTGSIDLAFLDRADIVQYIGPPTREAIYEIYRSAIANLQQVGIVTDREPIPPQAAELTGSSVDRSKSTATARLEALAEQSVGLSGRSLRKVPFLAHALFVQRDETTLIKFLNAMRNAVRRMQADKSMLAAAAKRAPAAADVPAGSDVSGSNGSSCAAAGDERFVSM
uniref:Putative thyroid receptor-interacting protein 13 n=1 Tax=Culex tarsalis TaxID=7177 RepID=A0A1Q3EVE1_CULTA